MDAEVVSLKLDFSYPLLKQTTQTGSDLRLVIHKIFALTIYAKLFNVLLLHLYRLELPVTRGT